MTRDPYQAPLARIHPDGRPPDPAGSEDADRERRALLGREAAIRTVGGFAMPVGLGILAFGTYGLGRELLFTWETIGFVLAAILIGAGSYVIATAWGLLRLRPWAKWTVIVGALPGLLLTAPLLAFSGSCLYLVLSARGRQVLSQAHVARRWQTPDLRARSRPGEALALVGVLVLNVAAVAWIVAGIVPRR